MKFISSKIFTEFIAGVFGGTILGIAGFLIMIDYGGNNGCWPIIDAFFDTAGYESCGSFGAISGTSLGALIGITILSIANVKNYLGTSIWLAIGAFVLPLIYGIVTLWSPFEDLLIVPPVIIVFMISSIIPSALITGIVNCKSIWRLASRLKRN